MEMESKVEDLKEYICFLKHLYEEVRILQGQKQWSALGRQDEGGGQHRQAPCGHSIVGVAGR